MILFLHIFKISILIGLSLRARLTRFLFCTHYIRCLVLKRCKCQCHCLIVLCILHIISARFKPCVVFRLLLFYLMIAFLIKKNDHYFLKAKLLLEWLLYCLCSATSRRRTSPTVTGHLVFATSSRPFLFPLVIIG